MLLSLYQIFIFLLGHLHFFLHFFFTFMENLFKKHPIHCLGWLHKSDMLPSSTWNKKLLLLKCSPRVSKNPSADGLLTVGPLAFIANPYWVIGCSVMNYKNRSFTGHAGILQSGFSAQKFPTPFSYPHLPASSPTLWPISHPKPDGYPGKKKFPKQNNLSVIQYTQI